MITDITIVVCPICRCTNELESTENLIKCECGEYLEPAIVGVKQMPGFVFDAVKNFGKVR